MTAAPISTKSANGKEAVAPTAPVYLDEGLMDDQMPDLARTGYARVAVNQPVFALYDYAIPASLSGAIMVGSLVEVPFSGRSAKGCVTEMLSSPAEKVSPARIKAITAVLSPDYFVDPYLVSLGLWMGGYYYSPPGDALGCVSFIGYNDVAPQMAQYYELIAEIELPARAGARQRAVVEYLRTKAGAAASSEIQAETGATADVLRRLVQAGVLNQTEEAVHRADEYGIPNFPDKPLVFNALQEAAFAQVAAAMDAGQAKTFLLHGVTGSGKTEIYLQAIAKALVEGGQAIVLVPEISLTPQTVNRFRKRFGNVVGVYHSRLTIGQKFDLWRDVKSGRIQIMVGARSAIFTPFRHLRVVVVDEEHESSYKQDSSPRYHARDVAIMRAHQAGAVALLGSATPAVESYYKAQKGKFHLLTLPARVDARPMPPIRIIDMSQEVRENQNPDLFSQPLTQAIKQRVAGGDQVLLFLNRRGFFNFMVCLACNTPVTCRHCDTTLTLHRPKNQLLCHLCGREYVPPKKCPQCEHEELSLLGMGTQRVEEYLQQQFPQARIIRMDLDTTRQRNAFLEAWRCIESGEVDIILGTQMIAKGIHLEQVTLVGVPLADVSLFQPDFRAAERAFSLLTQVAGRAGRGERPGEVILQTYVPHHYAIQFAQNHDYVGFYRKEIRVRQVLRFPPHYKLIAVLGTGKDEADTARLMKEFARIIKRAAMQDSQDLAVLGPVPAPISRIDDRYRWRLLLRSLDHVQMRAVLEKAFSRFEEVPGKSKILLIVDVDPLDLL